MDVSTTLEPTEPCTLRYQHTFVFRQSKPVPGVLLHYVVGATLPLARVEPSSIKARERTGGGVPIAMYTLSMSTRDGALDVSQSSQSIRYIVDRIGLRDSPILERSNEAQVFARSLENAEALIQPLRDLAASCGAGGG
jgi:hypothetical protein